MFKGLYCFNYWVYTPIWGVIRERHWEYYLHTKFDQNLRPGYWKLPLLVRHIHAITQSLISEKYKVLFLSCAVTARA
jgi:hypothetical protein